MATIYTAFAREVLDSRGMPTVECSIWLDDGRSVSATAPSGISIGKYEALELRDKDPSRFDGQGVLQAVNNINTVIAPQLVGKDPTDQTGLDQLLNQLDGTPNKLKLGANALIATSTAICKAGAAARQLPVYLYLQQLYQTVQTLTIPICIYGLMNGGQHGADNLDIQEFQIIPASHLPYDASLTMAVTLFHKLEAILISKGAIHSVGVVGGFAPNLYNNTDAFELLIETVKTSPYTFAQDLFFGVDVSASSFFEANKYTLKDKTQPYSAAELLEYYRTLRKQYHVFYIEDPFQEDDWESWKLLTAELGETTTIAGDDLLVSNPAKVAKAINEKTCNGITIKPNQVGTISETVQVINQARQAGWQVIISHRSGESNDDFLADLAVGTGADMVRFGPPNRGERVNKYNRLSQIYQELSAVTPQQ